MNLEDIRTYCLSLPLATEDTPFGPDCVAFRLSGKIFACIDLGRPWLFTAKCDAAAAAALRDRYAGIVPAWHWNKRLWNDVRLDADVPEALQRALLRHAQREVAAGLTRARRDAFEAAARAAGAEESAPLYNIGGEIPFIQ